MIIIRNTYFENIFYIQTKYFGFALSLIVKNLNTFIDRLALKCAYLDEKTFEFFFQTRSRLGKRA